MQLAQALCDGLIFGNISMAMLQQVFGAEHMVLLDHPPASQLAPHIYMLILRHTNIATSTATVAKLLEASKVGWCCQLEPLTLDLTGWMSNLHKARNDGKNVICCWQCWTFG